MSKPALNSAPAIPPQHFPLREVKPEAPSLPEGVRQAMMHAANVLDEDARALRELKFRALAATSEASATELRKWIRGEM